MIGAWRMGQGKPVHLSYIGRPTPWPSDFAPPTPSQMFARLALLLVVALGFALLVQFLL
jgi:hypothetical protein